MNRKVFAFLGVLALLAAMIPTATTTTFAAQGIDYKPVDVGPALREWEPTQSNIVAPPGDLLAVAAASTSATGTPYVDCAVDAKVWLALDNYNGSYFFDTFYKVAESAGAEVWVQADLSFPVGDPRPTPVITCEQAAYLVGEFDNNIYPTEVSFFGTPDLHDGSASLLEAWGYVPPGYYADSAGRQIVLVSNIEDDNYYDPTYPNYIAGFYSPTFEAYFDRNIMSIDSHDWANRVGPSGTRPYLYESVFAHEYQHLLHDDYDSDEETFINEGLSMFSEFLTGYIIGNDAYSTFEALPENSLNIWSDQGGREIVADYGMVFLYQMYLYEKFGPAFIQAEFHNPDNGITGINSTLAGNPQWQEESFGSLYHDFSVAVLIDDEKYKHGRYGFDNLDVAIDIGTAVSPNPDAFDTPGAPPWGADYIWIDGDPETLEKISFNGVDYSMFPTNWTTDGDVLWGGAADLVDNWAIFPAAGGGTLTFDSYWDIEDYWDFGFVQVSTDGGYTWTSLANAATTSTYDPNAHPDIIANLPGLTGYSGGWVSLSYDLSAYAGQDVLVAFRYMTDWGTTYGGWYIDNVYMDGVLISDGTDPSVFMDITEVVPIDNNFTVTFVGIRTKKGKVKYKVHTMKLNEITEQGLFEVEKVLKDAGSAVMIVTFDAPEGFAYYGQYEYSFVFDDDDHGKEDKHEERGDHKDKANKKNKHDHDDD
ncbi:MAG: immune inhibitor A [Anaerolineales bacterium]|nr:immune inhibitor A [Anaerolineales bacterium]